MEEAIFPGGVKNENQCNGVQIVCEAIKYGAILITNDGESKTQPEGILGSRHKLYNAHRVEIKSPDEAVNFVREKIRERDKFNLLMASKLGVEIPYWSGSD